MLYIQTSREGIKEEWANEFYNTSERNSAALGACSALESIIGLTFQEIVDYATS